MYQTLLADASFFRFLLQCDRELAEKTRVKGCPSCGDVLHRADYLRRPRGEPRGLDEEFARRYSFCCAECRKRNSPLPCDSLGEGSTWVRWWRWCQRCETGQAQRGWNGCGSWWASVRARCGDGGGGGGRHSRRPACGRRRGAGSPSLWTNGGCPEPSSSASWARPRTSWRACCACWGR